MTFTPKRYIFRTYKEKALELLPDGPGRVLDVGCGTGVNSERIRRKGHEIVGIDVSETAISRYRDNGFEGFVHDINSPLPESYRNSFDVVWAADVLEHLESPEAALENIHDILKEQGTLILTTINSSWFVFRVLYLLGKTVTELQHPHHIKFFNVHLLSKCVEDAGFSVIEFVGRNNIFIIPENNKFGWLAKMFGYMGIKFTREWSIKHSRNYLHLSYFSRHGRSFLADNLIIVAQKK